MQLKAIAKTAVQILNNYANHINDTSFNFAAGPWINKLTPDINNSSRFLRGGSLEQAFQIEEDAFQEHHHEHTHNYYDHYGASIKSDYGYELSVSEPYSSHSSTTGTTYHGKIVAADKTSSARIATETRPKNIRVVYLMKCWHLGQE